MGIGDWYGLVYTSAEDAKSSLPHITDVKLLRRALAKARTMSGQKTKIKFIESRLRELTGCQFKGCRKKATTEHCTWCGIRTCKDHKGPGNHGGLKGEINHDRANRP